MTWRAGVPVVWKRLFHRKDEHAAPTAPSLPPTRRPRRRDTVPVADPALQGRLDHLRQRRELVLFDVERAEAATSPDNPWQERVDLLGESLAEIEADLAALDQERESPGVTLPETPITRIAAIGDEPATVAFTIGGEHFRFEEERDWDQRGGPVVRGDLRRRSGDVAKVIPANLATNRELVEELTDHLAASVVVLATDLRDRAVDGAPLPAQPTLADLARPCEECGGWRDWRGTCDRCAERAFRRQRLRAEADRLRGERDAEADERRKWADRLPIAYRRLADVEAEIARLTS